MNNITILVGIIKSILTRYAKTSINFSKISKNVPNDKDIIAEKDKIDYQNI